MDNTQLTTAGEFENVINNGVCLIDFNAPWCGPCRSQEPIIKQLKEDFAGKVTVVEMNVDENREIAVRLGIQSIPTIAVFKGGLEVERFIGLQTRQTLSRAIETHL